MKSLNSSRKSPWVVESYPIGNTEIYKEYSVMKIPKLGATTIEKLQELGIETVGELKKYLPQTSKIWRQSESVPSSQSCVVTIHILQVPRITPPLITKPRQTTTSKST